MDYFCGWCKSKRRLEGYTTIVTGSNTGIGKETAMDFYRRGARVIMACRNATKAEAAKSDIEKICEEKKDNGTLIVEILDLCSLKSVKEFALRILEREKSINILVNNAGVMMCPKGTTEDGFETHIGSNHFGHALLTLLLLPVMAKSAPSRIVTVSSYLHSRYDLPLDDLNFERSTYSPYAGYCRSKAANVLFSRALALKLKEHNIEGVTTYSLHPGVISTELLRHFDSAIWNGTTWIMNNVISWFMQSPASGAQTSIYCAVDEACADQTGLYYSYCSTSTASKQCRDDKFAVKFWDHTVNVLNYNPFSEDGHLKSYEA